MKVLQLGDMAGVAYNLTGSLREFKIDANMVVWKKHKIFPDERWLYYPQTENKMRNLVETYYLIHKFKDYDIFHAHSGYNLYMLPFHRKKYVAHFHGSDIREVAATNSIQGKLLRRCMIKADAIVVSTIDLIKDIRGLGMDMKKVHFLPNPINIYLFKKHDASVDLHQGHDVVLFSPTLVQRMKRTEKLINAFKEISDRYDVILYLIDSGDSLYNEEIKNLIRKSGIMNIRYLPPIEPGDMHNYYNACDIVLDQFNDEKVFGQISVEGMACEKPVINSLAESYEPFFEMPPIFKGNTEEDIKKSLLYLIENTDERNRAGRRGRQWVEKYHSHKKVIGELIKIYATL